MQYGNISKWLSSALVFVVALAAGCGGTGEDGSSCTTEKLENGNVLISCEDGTTSTIEAPEDGDDCSAEDNGDGTFTITCAGADPFTVDTGDDESCTAADNGDGSYTIDCPGQAPVTLDTSTETCTAADNGDGSFTVDCPGQDPITFEEDSQCTLSDNGDGTHDLTCGDETVTVRTAVCGDGVVEGAEECDAGQEIGTCTAQCEQRHEYIVAGNYYDKVEVLDLETNTWKTYTDTDYAAPYGGTVLSDGVVLNADYVFAGIHQTNLYTGEQTAFATGLGNPSDVTKLSTGEIVVTDNGLRIVVFDSDGNKQKEFTATSSWSFAKVAAGPNGELYALVDECTLTPDPCIDNGLVGSVVEIDIANETTTDVSTGGDLTGVGALAVDPSGTIYAATSQDPSSAGTLVSIDPTTGAQTVQALPSGQFSKTRGMAITHDGDLITATDFGAIWNITTSTQLGSSCPGTCSINGITYARFKDPVF